MKQPTWMTSQTKQNRIVIPEPLAPFASEPGIQCGDRKDQNWIPGSVSR